MNIFWESETATERILLFFAGLMLLKPGFWVSLLIFYVLFEIMLLWGNYVQKKGLLVGAQIVITGVLFFFFHDFSVIREEPLEGDIFYLPSIGIIAAVALAGYTLIMIFSMSRVAMWLMVSAVDICMVFRCVNGIRTGKYEIAATLILTFLEAWRVLSLLGGRIAKRQVRYLKGTTAFADFRWLVFFVIMEMLVLIVPSSDEPIDWSFVYKVGYKVRDGFETIVENTGYYISGIGAGSTYQGGYSSLAETPGDIKGVSRDELYITTEGSRNSLYLAGHIEGDSGETADEMSADRFLDFLYALYSHDVDREEAGCFGKVKKLSVEFGYLRTKDVIRPENTLLAEFVKEDDLTEDGMHFRKTKKKGYKYDVTYLNVDYGSNYLEKIMSTPQAKALPSYNEMQVYCGKLYDYQLGRSVSETEYLKWANNKKDLSQYLDTGKYATERMRILAEDITKDAGSGYDACRRIEKYLRQYRYTTSPGEKTEHADSDNYIERFLFETGEGYCLHFAGSMVMLLRQIGIPSRLVEGYCYTFPESKYDRYVVNGDRAHAWVEAYIEGIGWVPFEPTSSRRTSLDSSWNITLPEMEENAGNEEALYDEESQYDQYVPEIPEIVADHTDEASEDEMISKKKVLDLVLVTKTVGTIIAGLIIYALIMWAMIQFVRFCRYNRAPLSVKLEKNIKDILWYLDREYGLSDNKVRLLEDYAAKLPENEIVSVGQMEATDLKTLAEHIFSVYYCQRFAGRNASAAEVRDSEYLRDFLRKRYLKRYPVFLRKNKSLYVIMRGMR